MSHAMSDDVASLFYISLEKTYKVHHIPINVGSASQTNITPQFCGQVLDMGVQKKQYMFFVWVQSVAKTFTLSDV